MRRWLGEISLGFLALLLVIAAAVIAAVVIGVIQWTSAPVRGKLAAREQIQANGNYRIAAYNHFFDLCASAQTKQAAIKALKQELASGPDAARKAQIQASITANQIGLADDANTYNADAHKSYTLGQFRSSGLPYTLDQTKEVTCGA